MKAFALIILLSVCVSCNSKQRNYIKTLQEWYGKEIVFSNNLNQYTKRANEIGSIYQADIQDLQERLDRIWEDVKDVLVHLSGIY